MESVAPHPGPLGDEGDAFFLHAVTKANKFERVAKQRKNALGEVGITPHRRPVRAAPLGYV